MLRTTSIMLAICFALSSIPAYACTGKEQLTGGTLGCSSDDPNHLVSIEQCNFAQNKKIVVSVRPYTTSIDDSVSVAVTEVHYNRFTANITVSGRNGRHHVCGELGFHWTAVPE
jgi:hypothetical protein